MAVVETPHEIAARIRDELGTETLIVCILGSTKLSGSDTEALVRATARELEHVVGSDAKFITGGMAGVQEIFAKSCGDGERVWNMLPFGEASVFDAGGILRAGLNLEERKAVFANVGDLYITFEGGPGVSQEVRVAKERGAAILPVSRTGGASSGMFEFAAVERPEWATEQQWQLLADKDAHVDETAEAVASMVRELATRHKTQPSIWELIDQLIGMDRSTLIKVLAFVLLVLTIVSICLMYREVSRGRLDLALLHGGFLVLLFGLVMSVAFVMSEVTSLEAQAKSVLADSEATALKKAE